MRKIHTLAAPVLSLLLLPTFAAPRRANSGQQHREEKVVKIYSFSDQPISLSSFSVGGIPVKSGQAFAGGSDLLQQVSFDTTNVSAKTITYLEVVASMPEGPVQIRLGQFGSYTPKAGVAPTAWLRPGETRHFEYSQNNDSNYLDSLPDDVKQRVADPSKIKVWVGHVVFDDDTMWNFGKILVRSQSNPDRWEVIRR